MVVVLIGVSTRALDHATPIYYYRVLDQQTLVIGTDGGAPSWTRVTGVTETPSTITITVGSLPSAAGDALEIVVKLSDQLGTRIVLDGSSGTPVRRTRCLPPSYFAAGCT